MTAKEYLAQGRHLDARIDAKIQQLETLNALARNATSTLTGMPTGSGFATSKLEDVVTKIVDLQNEINADIDRLVDLKRDIRALIDTVEDVDQKTLLELRYINFYSWEQIIPAMSYSRTHIFRLHEVALETVEKKNNRKDGTKWY